MMRHLLFLCATLCALSASASAGIVFEFDGESWPPKPKRKILKQSKKGSLCLIADSGTPMEKLTPVLKLLDQKNPRPLKLQVHDQFTSVTLDHSISGKDIGEDSLAVLTGPGGTYLTDLSHPGPLIGTTSKLGLDLEGIQAFITHATKSYETQDGDKTPVTAIMARSNCTFAQFVTVAQILNQSGMGSVAIAINDVLNVLAKHKIEKVTFTDLIDAE